MLCTHSVAGHLLRLPRKRTRLKDAGLSGFSVPSCCICERLISEVTLSQIKTYTEMDSHEERLHGAQNQ